MPGEIPLQSSLFDNNLKDTRNRRQRRNARLANLPQPMEMFSTREVAQLGVRRSPMNLVSRSGKRLRMKLEIEDPRTEAEKEADRQREAESLTYSLFGDPQPESEQVEALVTDLRKFTEQLTEVLAVAVVMLERSSEILEQLELRVSGTDATMSDGSSSKIHGNGRLHPPEEFTKDGPNLFGPGFHQYRSSELWPSARAGGL